MNIMFLYCFKILILSALKAPIAQSGR